MRRVALVLIGCVTASFAVLAALILWLGWMFGIAVGPASQPWWSLCTSPSSAHGNDVGGPPTQRPEIRCPATTCCAQRRPRPLAPSRSMPLLETSPLARSDRLRAKWLVQLRLDRQRRSAEHRPDRSKAPRPLRGRPHPDAPRIRTPGRGDRRRTPILSGGDADTWCLLVEPTAEGRTRLVSRWRQDWPKSFGTFVWTLISDPGAFVMERKMLRTIRSLAEPRRVD
jgi:hypothetical protein